MIARRSGTRVLHFVSETPVGWHSKNQATAKSSACRLESSSARACVEKITHLRVVLLRLGASVREELRAWKQQVCSG